MTTKTTVAAYAIPLLDFIHKPQPLPTRSMPLHLSLLKMVPVSQAETGNHRTLAYARFHGNEWVGYDHEMMEREERP